MAIFDDWIYWSDWTAGAVLKVGRRGNNGTTSAPLVVKAGLTLPMVIQAIHPAVQAAGEKEGCGCVGVWRCGGGVW